MATRRFSIQVPFELFDKISAPIRNMRKNVTGFGNSTKRAFDKSSKSASRFGGILKSVKGALGAVGIAAGIGIVTAALGGAIMTGMQFEQTMVNAAVKFPGEIRKGSKEFKELEKVAKDIGAGTKFSASEAAAGLDFLAMAGFDAKQAMGALPGVVDLATASNVDLATAADISSDTLGAFNLMTKDSIQLQKNLARVSDVMAATTTSANTNMELMFETIKEGGPIASLTKTKIEEFSAMTAVMANAGIKGSKAGTTLKNVFLRLADPPAEAAKALAQLGVKTRDSSGKMRKVTDVLKDMRDKLKLKKFIGREAEFVGKTFGKIAAAGATSMLTNVESIEEFEKKFLNAGGTTRKMAEAMNKTTMGAFLGMKAAMEGVSIELFAVLGPALQAVFGLITRGARATIKFLENSIALKIVFTGLGLGIKFVTAMISEVYRWITVLDGLIGGWASRILVLAGIVFALVKIIKIWTIVQGILNMVMAMNPIVLIIMGLIALGAIIGVIINKWDKIVAKLKAGWKWVKGIFGFGEEEKKESKLEERTKEAAGALETTTAANRAAMGGAVATSRVEETKTNKSTVDININNAPAGTSIKQKGRAPGVNVAMGAN